MAARTHAKCPTELRQLTRADARALAQVQYNMLDAAHLKPAVRERMHGLIRAAKQDLSSQRKLKADDKCDPSAPLRPRAAVG